MGRRFWWGQRYGTHFVACIEPLDSNWRAIFSCVYELAANSPQDNTLIPISLSTMTPLAHHKESVQTNQCVFSWSSNHLFSTHGDGTVKISRYDTSTLPTPSSSTTSLAATSQQPFL